MTDKPVTQEEIAQIKAAINSLAYLMTRHKAWPPGAHPELDAIRAEMYTGKGSGIGDLEQRPFSLPETRDKAVA